MTTTEQTIENVLLRLDNAIEQLNTMISKAERERRLLQTQRDLLQVPEADTFQQE